MNTMSAVHHRWEDIPIEQINSSISRRYISADRFTVARFDLKRGGVVPEHAHENEQFTIVLSGALRFHLEGTAVLVKSGEALQIPSGLAHEAEVVEDASVIDIFSPVRQDWIDKTDDYFRRDRPA